MEQQLFNIDLLLQVMSDLAKKNSSEITHLYKVVNYDGGNYFDEDNHWFGVNLGVVRFKASNKYELWLKIYDYFKANAKTSKCNLEDISYNDRNFDIYYMCQLQAEDIESDLDDIMSENEDITDYDAMAIFIDDMLESWIDGEYLFWKKDKYNVV